MIYLYIKEHINTGLKYLGKTISNDPLKYPGSGVYWTYHLKKHGNNVKTTILRECNTEDELVHWGKHYSKLWNVVEDKNWANLTEEAGPGGSWGEESRNKLSATKKKQLSNMTKLERQSYVRRSCSSPESWTEERKRKISLATTGSPKTKTPKLLEAEAARKNRTIEQKLKCGAKHKGRTWKLIDGKRVWLENVS